MPRVLQCMCSPIFAERRYPELEQYPGRSMCSIPGAQISESNTADTAALEGGDQINTLLQVEDLVHSAKGNYVENLAERMYLLELCLYQVL